MSIDLSRPLVQSMGQHDPLDGFITYTQLQMCVADDSEKSLYPDLNEEITDMANICKGKSWMDHRDINMVMLATSLSPDGFLTL